MPPGFALEWGMFEAPICPIDKGCTGIHAPPRGILYSVHVYTRESGFTQQRSAATWDEVDRRLVFHEVDPQDEDTLRQIEREMRGDAD